MSDIDLLKKLSDDGDEMARLLGLSYEPFILSPQLIGEPCNPRLLVGDDLIHENMDTPVIVEPSSGAAEPSGDRPI